MKAFWDTVYDGNSSHCAAQCVQSHENVLPNIHIFTGMICLNI